MGSTSTPKPTQNDDSEAFRNLTKACFWYHSIGTLFVMAAFVIALVYDVPGLSVLKIVFGVGLIVLLIIWSIYFKAMRKHKRCKSNL